MIPRRAALPTLLLFAAAAFAQGGGIPAGRWEGAADLGSGEEPLVVRLLEKGALIDLPARRMFGYPSPAYWRESGRIIFTIPGESGDFVFDAAPLASGGGDRPQIAGSCSGAKGFESRFSLAYAPLAERGEEFGIRTARGVLAGTLLVPARGARAVVLLVAGEGPIDRDGNNYAVPGRSDSLKALAEALADLGIASLRYDKRGAGESYALVGAEDYLVYADHVDDAADALRELASSGRFGRLIALGHGSGGLVAAAAMAAFRSGGGSDGDGGAGPASGRGMDCRLVLVGTSADSPLEAARAMVETLPAPRRDEGRRIVASLAAGRIFPAPSAFFADYFHLDVQPYLISSYRFDLAAELAKAGCPLLCARGSKDPSVTAADSRRIAAMRPDARLAHVEGMGRALKELGEDPEEDYRSFVDPLMPLARGLGPIVAAFAAEGLAPAEAPEAVPAEDRR